MTEVNWSDGVPEDPLTPGAAIILWASLSATQIAIGVLLGYFIWG